MKVYLLDVASSPARRLFFAEPPAEGDRADGPPSTGFLGRFESRWRRLRAGWEHSPRGPARWGRNVWDWLRRRAHPDEPLLARLRSATAIEVRHPPSLSAAESRAAWSAFLARGRRRHWPWFVVNALIAPLTIPIAALPGPNLVGYWFVYRAVRHWLILVGLRRTRAGVVTTHFLAEGALESADPDCLIARLSALGCDPDSVAVFLGRHGVRQPVREPREHPSLS